MEAALPGRPGRCLHRAQVEGLRRGGERPGGWSGAALRAEGGPGAGGRRSREDAEGEACGGPGGGVRRKGWVRELLSAAVVPSGSCGKVAGGPVCTVRSAPEGWEGC